jgi:hypothetical protein
MTIADVINNLDNTIKGKEMLMRVGHPVFVNVIQINIDELKRIKADLEKVEAERIADLNRMRDDFNERIGKA